jgi:outer membrane murein-binding lipoprotein Lpp
MFFTIAVGVACFLAGLVVEAKFGTKIKSDVQALVTEVRNLASEVRNAKTSTETAAAAIAADIKKI